MTTSQTRTVQIELTESEYWFLTAVAATDTQTPEEYIKSLIEYKLEALIDDDKCFRKQSEIIASLTS